MFRLFLSVLICAAMPASARDISGSLVHLARIALPQNAELVVELADATGTVAELREAVSGRQVPFPFRLTVADDGPLTLDAAIFVRGELLWAADSVRVPAGDQDVDLGEIRMSRGVASGAMLRLVCGETVVEVGYVGAHARLRVDGRLFDLAPLPAASGMRYGDGRSTVTELRSKGDSVSVTIEGEPLRDCRFAAPPALLPITARGNEPGWVVSLSQDGMMLSTEEGARLTVPLPDAKPVAGGVLFDGGPLVVTVADGICRDSMTGMPFPHPVTVVHEGQSLQGCGGDPAVLLAGRWRLLFAGDDALPDGAEILFDGDRVSGQAACNRFMGGMTLSGEGLSFGALATTRMGCGGGLMQLEAAVLGAFGRVDRFDLSDAGHLLLIAGDRPLIEAAR